MSMRNCIFSNPMYIMSMRNCIFSNPLYIMSMRNCIFSNPLYIMSMRNCIFETKPIDRFVLCIQGIKQQKYFSFAIKYTSAVFLAFFSFTSGFQFEKRLLMLERRKVDPFYTQFRKNLCINTFIKTFQLPSMICLILQLNQREKNHINLSGFF